MQCPAGRDLHFGWGGVRLGSVYARFVGMRFEDGLGHRHVGYYVYQVGVGGVAVPATERRGIVCANLEAHHAAEKTQVVAEGVVVRSAVLHISVKVFLLSIPYWPAHPLLFRNRVALFVYLLTTKVFPTTKRFRRNSPSG